MANIKGCFSHKTDDWATPKKLYDYFMSRDYIDPCPLYSKEDNLNKVYKYSKLFINPPYSKINEWVKFIKNNKAENIIVLLIPSRTDTKYFQELLELKPYLMFIKGRLKFGESKEGAPFPSVLLRFTPRAPKGLYIGITIDEIIEKEIL